MGKENEKNSFSIKVEAKLIHWHNNPIGLMSFAECESMGFKELSE